jgi:uncharacterized protein YdeI (YjbR/CyaY-like superfamily)
MNITKTLSVTNRKDWRRWLKKHYKSEKEIWLIYYKIKSGLPRVAYNDAVEEALCFGWVDSTVKSLDQNRFAQRFSPRKPGSSYSQTNKIRLAKLIKEKQVQKDILENLGNIAFEKFQIPPDIQSAIKENKATWKNFSTCSKTYKEIRVGFIKGARNRPKEFKKRLNFFIKTLEKGKKIGFGGINKYS